MNQWQPIETAPKDGTWCSFTSTWNRHARWCARYEDGRWQDINEGENRPGHFEAFTHWMPLPEPPSLLADLAPLTEEQKQDQGGHVSHGGRDDLEPAAPPQLSHDGTSE